MRASSVILSGRQSMAQDMRWGQESVIDDGGTPSFCAEICPRAVRLVVVMPPAFVSSFFHQLMPAAALRQPEPDSPAYWEEVTQLAGAIPRSLDVDSQAFAYFKDQIPCLGLPAQKFLEGREVAMFALAFLRPRYRMFERYPDSVREDVQGLVLGMNDKLHSRPDVAQIALNILLFALANWELQERLELARHSLRLPCYLAELSSVGNGLLVASLQCNEAWRRKFYHAWLPRRIRPLSFDEFNAKTRVVRDDPVMAITLLQAMPARYPGMAFEREFAQEIYPDRDPPADVGRQALAFACKNVLAIWFMFGWSRARVTRERLVRLAARGWHVSYEEMARVLYMNV
jgi:hypothetical protein